jgi:trehalose 6-phosphate phosphatase
VRDILARSNRAALARFARSDVLLAFDFDGTLAPIVAKRDRAALRPRTRRLLGRLASLYPCVVISGRQRRDVVPRLEGTGVVRVVGNHGSEPSRRQREFRVLARRWRVALLRRLDRLPGVTLEDKGLSLSIHYRGSRRKARVLQEIMRAASDLPGARVVGGKHVVNVLPGRAPNKGTALERERRRLGCDTALYVGDDETDEDVFARSEPRRLLTVRVGPLAGSLAGYRIRDQGQIDVLLRTLITLRHDPVDRRAASPREN